ARNRADVNEATTFSILTLRTLTFPHHTNEKPDHKTHFLSIGPQSSQVRRALAASAQDMNLGSTRSIYEPVAGIFKRTVAR
ncbi:hypothetical protein, partial [Trueperella pyogenes]